MADTAALDRANKLLDDQQPAEAVKLLTGLVEREPENAEAHNLLGLALRETGRLEDAVAEFSVALNLDTTFVEDYLFSRANVLYQMGYFDRAIADVEQLVRLNPTSRGYLENRAKCRLRLGDEEGAAADYCTSIGLFATERGNHLTEKQLLLYLDQVPLSTDRALTHLWQTISNLAEKHFPTSYFVLYAKGFHALYAGHADKAIELASSALQLKPTSAEPHNLLGLALADLGKNDSAITEFSRALELDESSAETFLANRASLLYDMHQYDQALADYGRLMKLAPDVSDYVYSRGVCRYQLGDDDGAVDDYCTSLRLFADEEGAMLSEQPIFAHLQRWTPAKTKEAAASIWSSVLHLAREKLPDSVLPLHAEGLVAYFNGDIEASLNILLEALRKHPRSWQTADCIGRIYNEQGNRRTAAGYFRKALVDAGDEASAELCSFAGWCFGKLKDSEREIDAYQRCLKSAPNYQFARNNLGWALLKAGRPLEAISYLKASLDSGADGPAPIYNLARAYKGLGRYSEAIDVLRLDTTKRGEITKAAQREIQKLEMLVQSGRADDRAASDDDEATDDGGDPSPVADVVDEVTRASVASVPTTPSATVPLERLLEQLIEEKILRGHEVFGRRLLMHEAPDGLYGRQFPAGDAGRIDLLTVDIESGGFVVIELKRGDDFAGAVQQTARYVVWVKRNLARRRQEVHGVVCLDKSCAALESAARAMGIDVYEYDLRLIRKA